MSTLIVILEALLINVWVDDRSSYIQGNWPDWIGTRLVPLGCLAVLVALLFCRGEKRACRLVFRGAVVTVLACLINFLPFVLNDLDHHGDAQHLEIEPSAAARKASTLRGSLVAFFESTKSSADLEEAQMQSRYLTALSRCIEQKTKQQRSSYKAAKSECIAEATQIGHRAFILRNWIR